MREGVLEPERATGIAPSRWPYATRPVVLVAAVFAAAHVVLGFFGDYWLDEAYMVAAGRHHLAWGYVDQPPLAPLLAGAMSWLTGGYLPLVRLPAVLVSASGVLLAALITRELGGDRRSQVLTSVAFTTGLWTSLVAHWITPYTLEVPLWMVLTWVLVRWLRGDAEQRADDRLLLVFGAVAGITMEVKFQVAVLCAALLGGLVLFGPWRLLRRPMLWGGALIALVLSAPTLIWQALHGWPQLAMGAVVAGESPLLSGGRTGTATAMVLYAGILGAILFLCGLWRMFFSAEVRAYRFVGFAVVAQYAFYLATAARPYYLVGLYGLVIGIGALGLQRRREIRGAPVARRQTWLAWSLGVSSVALASTMMAASLTLTGMFGVPTDGSLTKETATAYRALPPETRARTAIVGEDYFLAALLDTRADEFGLPPSYSAHRGYGYFGPPDETVRDVLYVGKKPQLWRSHFAEVRRVGGSAMPVWLLSGRNEPWSQLWSRVRSLD